MKRAVLAVIAVLVMVSNAAAIDCTGKTTQECMDANDALAEIANDVTVNCRNNFDSYESKVFAAGDRAYCKSKAAGNSEAVARKAQKRAVKGYGRTAPEIPPFFQKACTNWNVGKLTGVYSNEEGIMRTYQLTASAELDEKILSAKYGPFEGAITSADLGFGVRRGFTYKSLAGTYQRAIDLLSEAEMRVLLAIIGENMAKLPKSPLYGKDIPLQRGISSIAGGIGGESVGFNQFATPELAYGGPQRTDAYKSLWRALAASDPAAFADTIRAYQATKQYKAIKQTMDDWCDPGRDED